MGGLRVNKLAAGRRRDALCSSEAGVCDVVCQEEHAQAERPKVLRKPRGRTADGAVVVVVGALALTASHERLAVVLVCKGNKAPTRGAHERAEAAVKR